jgi:hypothetical protein
LSILKTDDDVTAGDHRLAEVQNQRRQLGELMTGHLRRRQDERRLSGVAFATVVALPDPAGCQAWMQRSQ